MNFHAFSFDTTIHVHHCHIIKYFTASEGHHFHFVQISLKIAVRSWIMFDSMDEILHLYTDILLIIQGKSTLNNDNELVEVFVMFSS